MFGAETGNLADLAQYGVLGLVVLGFIFGKIVPGYFLERREKELAERDAKIEKMTETFEGKVLPALFKASEVLETAMRVIEELEHYRRDDPSSPKRRG